MTILILISFIVMPSMSSVGPQYTYLHSIAIHILPGAAEYSNPHFSISQANVSKGTLVTWINDDNAVHTITSGTGPDDPNSGKNFDSSFLTLHQHYSHTFLTFGEFPYYCQVHPFMRGVVNMTNDASSLYTQGLDTFAGVLEPHKDWNTTYTVGKFLTMPDQIFKVQYRVRNATITDIHAPLREIAFNVSAEKYGYLEVKYPRNYPYANTVQNPPTFIISSIQSGSQIATGLTDNVMRTDCFFEFRVPLDQNTTFVSISAKTPIEPVDSENLRYYGEDISSSCNSATMVSNVPARHDGTITPYQQHYAGVQAKDVICPNNLKLVVQPKTGQPFCVTEGILAKLTKWWMLVQVQEQPNSNQSVPAVSNMTNSSQSPSYSIHAYVSKTIPVGSAPLAVALNNKTGLIYVTNHGADLVNKTAGFVSVINASSDKIVANITVGVGPNGIAFNPSTNLIYVTNDGQSSAGDLPGSVSVIDSATNKVVATIPVGKLPSGISVNPTTNTVYVANVGDNTVSVISGTNSNSTTIKVGRFPASVALDPTRDRVYISNVGDGTVSVINSSTNKVIATIPVAFQVRSIAVNPNTNTIYVFQEDHQEGTDVAVIDGNNNTVITRIPVSYAPGGIAIDASNNVIYASTSSSDGNWVYLINGTTNAVMAKVPVGLYASALSIDSDNVYVANNGDNTISILKVDLD